MAKLPTLTISVTTTAEAHERKSAPLLPPATEVHGTGDWQGYLNATRDGMVVRCRMADGQWRVAYVSLDKLVDDVGRAMNDVGREGLL
jgi:hypothetical protein